MIEERNQTPFPSMGKGRGWGAGAPPQDVAHEASSSAEPRPSRPVDQQPARTPPNPPHRGEGFDDFANRDRAAPSVVRRAGRLRATPTFTEAKLWKRLRQFEVRFRRQAPIGPYVVDFACHRAALVIEVDGGVHDLPEVAVRDMRRDEWLIGQGYRVLRFTTKQVENDIESVLLAIRQACPLPLDGEGAGGWGAGRAGPKHAPLASSPDSPSQDPKHSPSQPFPLEGKGSSDA